jgi:two-component system, cell cycle sensor histidine kinase and response regulator CckA
VISSGYNQQEVSERLFGHGLAGFIQKPYRLAEVSRKLQEVLG